MCHNLKVITRDEKSTKIRARWRAKTWGETFLLTDTIARVLQKRGGGTAYPDVHPATNTRTHYARSPASHTYVCMYRTRALCTVRLCHSGRKRGQMLDVVRLWNVDRSQIAERGARVVAVSGANAALAWKGTKLPVNGRRIMPTVFVSLARHSLEEFNSPHAHKAPDPRILGGLFPVVGHSRADDPMYKCNYVSIWRFAYYCF